ncbi:hypothetical protein PAAG_11811 [Paracoccidioides lutzii Pb01]|uniref:Uncharacterized protein n=1 Tax=Paracoccidioides lutzii (strain ATCC MYA-826 / Pb01) TaxID=502779 RepID=A0A0A2V0W5_PARBA|nr:hypothetical protein PAAG_11811 [Paracoccidioides lutzii Pb01]KGQ01461.1 hypothetical protein PAAG_11811 [Paracoccidioides lutzii Pb01]
MACTSPNNCLAAYDPEWDPWAVKKKRCSSAPRPWEARSRLRDILASASSVKRQNSIGVGRRVWMAPEFYQDREYMRYMNMLLAGVPISDEEKAEPKDDGRNGRRGDGRMTGG